MANIRREFGDDLTLKNGNLGINTTTAQERVDVVGVVKGQDLYTTGVSSLTAYEGFLRADNQIVESTTLEFGQGLKSSLSGEIIVGTGVTVTIGAVGLGTAEVGNGSGTIENTIDTTDINLAGGSQIECLKVYNTFTPPNGGTNERPYAPKPGELYYNYDFKTIEFFDGYGWRQVDNTTRSGRGVFAGGYDFTNPGQDDRSTIEFIQISTLGNTSNFGDLLEPKRVCSGCSSSTRGLNSGGLTPSPLDVIEYVTIASAGNSIDFGNLTVARYAVSALSSSTRGINGGGFHPAQKNELDYVEIATIGNALDFGDLSAGTYGPAGCSNGTRGLFGSGERSSPAGQVTHIDAITIQSKGNAVKFGDLTYRTYGIAAGSNSVTAIYGGGATTLSNINKITIASDGNVTDFGNLTVKRRSLSATASQTRVVFAGGYGSPAKVNTIDYVTIASSGNAFDFGDLSRLIEQQSAFSDSHGGLGGF
jgi:hypothetical protein